MRLFYLTYEKCQTLFGKLRWSHYCELLSISNERIEIVSFPGPDRSITLEGLKNYRVSNRRYRNRRIGDFLKELYLTEGRNTGFKKILDALANNGSPKPEFETDDERSYFISRLFIHEGFATDNSKVIQKMGTVTETLAKGEKIQLIGFGNFEVKERKEREGRNPRNPEEVVKIAASKAPVFKAGKALKDAVNK